MKKLLTAIAALGLIGTPAFAADMAVKAPPPAPAPVPIFSWTGAYVGLFAGYGWAKADATEPFDAGTGFFYNFGGNPSIRSTPTDFLVAGPWATTGSRARARHCWHHLHRSLAIDDQVQRQHRPPWRELSLLNSQPRI
jgi:opacity protein-like surface antigen